METKQFTFTGLNWMAFEEIQKVREQLLKLKDYGIEFEFVLRNDVQLVIYGFTDILENRECDDKVTFLHKFQGYYKETNEDSLLIFTIDEDMKIKAKVLNYWGDVENINL